MLLARALGLSSRILAVSAANSSAAQSWLEGVDGFLAALTLTMRLKPGGLLWMAPNPTSFMPKDFPCRNEGPVPLGDETLEAVALGNGVAKIAAFMWRICYERGRGPILARAVSERHEQLASCRDS